MLSNIRNFSKTIFAKLLLFIIIIPFVFWGMGGVFSGGNSNNIAEINNKNISTQDFVDYINESKIDQKYIKDNIDNNVLEEILSELISKNMLKLEINDLNIKISDKILSKKIKENQNFLNDNNKFSRIKYEKFLLSSNITAAYFESKLKENELRKKLFAYVSGGIKSPFFEINNLYKSKNKKINIDYINLKNIYKKKDDFTENELLTFMQENKKNLQQKNVSLDYVKITPKSLIGINEYNNDFFNTIDEIENSISNEISYSDLVSKYNLKSETKKNLNINEVNNTNNKEFEFIKKIVNDDKIDNIGLIDKNDYYILYNIIDVNETIPSISNVNFKNKLKDQLYNNAKFKYNRSLYKKINDKKFDQTDFIKLSKENNILIENIEIKSINDNKFFSSESIKYLYSFKENSLTLINDIDKNIYLINVKRIFEENILKSSENFIEYENQSNIKIRDQLYSSYDLFLNNKYKVKINQKTLERVKNYFR